MNTETKVYELREYYLITLVHDNPQTRPNEDYNTVTWKPDTTKGFANVEFLSYSDCLDYMRACEKPNVAFQVQKLYRRVESQKSAYKMLALSPDAA